MLYLQPPSRPCAPRIGHELSRLQAEAARRQDAQAAIDGSDAAVFPGAETASPDGGDGQEAARKPPGPLHNQFNFSERAAQSAVHPPRDRVTNTEPPPTEETSGQPPMHCCGAAYCLLPVCPEAVHNTDLVRARRANARGQTALMVSRQQSSRSWLCISKVSL